ncbi:MAG: type II toxin-antitoxin system HicA family toxin [Ktedonobacterales bacterium]
MNVREVIAAIEADGWHLVAVRGDHRQCKHPTKRGQVTIPVQLNDDLHPKTRDSILRQASLPQPRR